MARERFSMEEAGVNLLWEHDTEPGSCLERNQGGIGCVREGEGEMKGKREERERGAGGRIQRRERHRQRQIFGLKIR